MGKANQQLIKPALAKPIFVVSSVSGIGTSQHLVYRNKGASPKYPFPKNKQEKRRRRRRRTREQQTLDQVSRRSWLILIGLVRPLLDGSTGHHRLRRSGASSSLGGLRSVVLVPGESPPSGRWGKHFPTFVENLELGKTHQIWLGIWGEGEGREGETSLGESGWHTP